MGFRVYLETSFISACVTDRTDPGSVHRRNVSREWWETQARRHVLFVSAEVIDELSQPGYRRSLEALSMIREIPFLPITDWTLKLAALFVREKVMPSPVAGDAVHVAVAAAHGVDYLVSWNVRHLANIRKMAHLREICRRKGVVSPLIVTPDLLWEVDHETN